MNNILKKNKQGFTLIELLVVIAIIGILSSIVLVSLNTARNKGADAAIKSNLANIRAQAEIQYNNTADYGTVFTPAADCPGVGTTLFGNAVVVSQIDGARVNSGGLTSCHSTGATTATNWAVAVQLKTDLSQAWCSDSSGVSKQIGDASAYTQGTLDADLAGGQCGN